LPACSATGGAIPSGEFSVRSAASWLTRCASCAPLPQPTPFGVPEPECGPTPFGVPEPECGPTPLGVPGLGCGPTPFGAPVLVPWPDCLGGVSRHSPGTVAGPSRQRLRQWVAVSAASETACRRAAVHLPACSAGGGAVPSDGSGVRSAASWLT